MTILDAPWTLTPGQIIEHFSVDPLAGLSDDLAAKHALLYGKNELPEDPPTPLWQLVLDQFKDQLVLILLASAAISFLLAFFEDAADSTPFGAFVEPAVIFLILIANAVVGVVQETNAEKAIEALKEYSPDEANVIRSGRLARIHASELVPGDIVSVAVGDKIPADCRILSISSSSFRIDQAILTGESSSVNKSIDAVPDTKAVKQDMTNMLFSGTTVVNGTARAIVTSTGGKTAIGHIHHSISQQISDKTPLKRKLDDFGDMLAKVISVICVLVWLINFRHFWDPSHHGVLKGAIYYFKIAVALAVAAIPEGLAAVITAWDKISDLSLDPIRRLAEICAVCNDAKITYHAEKDVYSNIGEPTEAALKVLVEKLGCPDAQVTKSLSSMTRAARASAVNEYYERSIPRLLSFEFSRDRKMMSVLVRLNGAGALFVKGAPESILERCTSVMIHGGIIPLTSELRNTILAQVTSYASKGLRMLAMAYVNEKDTDAAHYVTQNTQDYARFERDLVFVSLVGMLDPPRPEVITKIPPEAICREIGIFVTRQKIEAVQRASLFSRTEPGHKSQLVNVLQGLGMVVAMTGDGVNDAPALKKADIGVAMGSGTDVAKLAADMVLADSNFATIEQAVEEGRLIYNNTKQFIRYLISSNIGEVVSIFLTVLLGMPEALIPVQLLWVNLVTDSLPATALGFNPADHSIMRVPPRNAREPLIGKWLFFRYMVIGVYVGCATVFGYAWWFVYYSGGPQITFHQLTHFHLCTTTFPEIGCDMFTNEMAQRATTMSLSILVTVEMFNAMNSLSENESLLRLPIWKNPFLVGAIALSMALHFGILYIPFFASLFEIAPLNWTEWQAVVYFSAPVILIDEVLKFVTVTVIEPLRS
ncbi:Ca-transporting ATPase [Chiua virens]|nr:Ca-transporting ATPase [Chiua virens]